ncbi:MAG: outer membrane lipoprotein-sorting protein [Verrucomicrobiota bacterium]
MSWSGLAAPLSEIVKQKDDGQVLAAELRSQRPTENTELTGVLKTRDGASQRLELVIRFQVIVGDGLWKAVYQTQPGPRAGAEKLIVIHTEGRPNHYLIARAEKSESQLPELVPCLETMKPFAGTDFWLADLGMEFLHWPEQRLIKKEMRRGRPCKVLESTNPQLGKGAYGRVRSWIDSESAQLILAEVYDSESRLLKEFSVGSVKKVKGHWELKDMQIRNEQTDSLTRLEFDLEEN